MSKVQFHERKNESAIWQEINYRIKKMNPLIKSSYENSIKRVLDKMHSIEHYQWLIDRINDHPKAKDLFNLKDFLKYPNKENDLDFIPDDEPMVLLVTELREFCKTHDICTFQYNRLRTWLDDSALPKVNDVFMLNCYYDQNDQQQCGVFKCVKEFTLQDINEHYNPNEDNDTLIADILVKQGYIEKLDIPLITIGYHYTK